MNVILFGPPGAGKGTQGALLAQRMGIPKVATGDLIRTAMREETALGRQAKGYYDQGLLVPDEIIVGLIEDLLASGDVADGIIMDGFPRTMTQAEAVDGSLAARDGRVDHVILFDVPDTELVRRVLGRAREQGRSDDTPETIKKRLAVYRRETEPLVARYRRCDVVLEVDGTGSVDEIAARVADALEL